MKGSIFEQLRRFTTNAVCARKGCNSGARATQIPVVTVWSNPEKAGKEENLIIDMLRVCPPCTGKMKVDDFISAELRGQITRSFEKSFTEVPCWETAELRWRDR